MASTVGHLGFRQYLKHYFRTVEEPGEFEDFVSWLVGRIGSIALTRYQTYHHSAQYYRFKERERLRRLSGSGGVQLRVRQKKSIVGYLSGLFRRIKRVCSRSDCS